MKKLLIRVLIALLVLLIGGLIWLNANASSLVAKHRDDIQKALSDTLKTPVSFGEIQVSVFPSTKFQIADFRVAGGLSLGELHLKVSPLALLTGTVKINELSLTKPHIVLAQTNAGWGVKGMPAQPQASSQDDSAHKTAASEAAKPQTGSPIALALDQFSLTDGSVRIEPNTGARPIEISDINVATGVALSGASVQVSDLSAGLSAMGAKFGARAESLVASGDVGAVNSKDFALITPGGDLNVNLAIASKTQGTVGLQSASPLKLSGFNSLVSQFAPPEVKPFDGTVALNIKADMKRSNTGAEEVAHQGTITLADVKTGFANFEVDNIKGDLKTSGTLNRHQFASDNLSLALNGAPIGITLKGAFNAEQKHAALEQLLVRAFGGTIQATGTTGLSEGAPLAAKLDVTGIDINQALSVLKNPALSAISGSVAKVTADIQSLNGAHLMNRLGGTASIDIRDGSIPGVNLVGPVIKALATIPILTGGAKAPPASVSTAADSPNTAFKAITGTFRIRDGVAETNDFVLTSPLFDLSATGTVSTAAQVNMRARILFEPSVSAAISGGEAKRILNPEGRLEVPIAIAGSPGAIVVTPDIERLMQTAAGAAVRDAASKFLDKAFGGGNKEKSKGGSLFGF